MTTFSATGEEMDARTKILFHQYIVFVITINRHLLSMGSLHDCPHETSRNESSHFKHATRWHCDTTYIVEVVVRVRVVRVAVGYGELDNLKENVYLTMERERERLVQAYVSLVEI